MTTSFLSYAQESCTFFDYVKFKTEKVPVNTSESDFGPAFVNNELWYSAFTSEEIEKLADGKTKDIFYNIFASPVDSKGNLKNDKSIQLTELGNNYHAGPVSWCSQTDELFVTLSNIENPEIRNKVYRKADVRLRIAIVKKENNAWKIDREFPHNSKSYSVGHPAISITGDTLVFASDMPEKGMGKTDLYMSVRDGEEWGEPVNLGASINTSENEMFPVIHNNMLLYASNGLGKGEDLDLYYSCITADGFAEHVEIEDLNSDADDFGLTIHPAQEVGYYASNKSGGKGSDDILKVEFEGQYLLELEVLDRKTEKSIPDSKVSFNDGIKATLAGMLLKRNLKKNSTYTVTTDIPGYKNESMQISTIGKPFGVIKATIRIEREKVEQKIVLNNIFYDYNKWDILPESEKDLDDLVKILKDNPTWKAELGSHTDSRGTKRYNKVLSKKRSDSAVSYIISKGISEKRIRAKGYGETELINECSDGVDCTESKHRENRRTEFKILKK